jgi:hypothetical protein
VTSNEKPLATLPIDLLWGWFVPGLGHLRRGLRRQGLVVLGAVTPLFVAGLFISDLEAVSREIHPHAFWAQLGVASGTLALVAIDPVGDKILPPSSSVLEPQDVSAWADTGFLFVCIAGLLNFLALFDLFDRSVYPPAERAADAARQAGGAG